MTVVFQVFNHSLALFFLCLPTCVNAVSLSRCTLVGCSLRVRWAHIKEATFSLKILTLEVLLIMKRLFQTLLLRHHVAAVPAPRPDHLCHLQLHRRHRQPAGGLLSVSLSIALGSWSQPSSLLLPSSKKKNILDAPKARKKKKLWNTFPRKALPHAFSATNVIPRVVHLRHALGTVRSDFS